VIHPPVDTGYFHPSSGQERDDSYLVVSQLVPYKRMDLAVEAFNRCGKQLLVIGEGSERRKLERRARANIRFLGAQPRDVLRGALQQARALIFPGEEDFGIVMAEALACRTPVIAFRRGGASEIVTEGETGVLFEDQTADSFLDGLARFERTRLNPLAMRTSALRFSRQRFIQEFASFLDAILAAKRFPAVTGLSPVETVQAAATDGP
jgi:glycosyltransferase involved in cell wall biosynthesis